MGLFGGGSSGPTEQTVTQTNLPEYAEPYVRDLFERAATESTRPYQAYEGQRIAGQDRFNTQAQQIAQNMPANPAGLVEGMQGTRGAYTQAKGIGTLQPTQFQANAPTLQGDIAGGQGFNRAAMSGYVGQEMMNPNAPDPRQFMYNQAVSQFDPGQYQTGRAAEIAGQDLYNFDPNVNTDQYQFGPQQMIGDVDQYSQGAAERLVGSELMNFQGGPEATAYDYGDVQQFTPQSAQDYMSPYMQNVVDVQKEQAQLDFDRQQAARDARAVQSGAFGGSRSAVADALAQEDLNRNLQDIQASGQQAAYQDAQRMFEADRAARMQRENERAGELGRVQELGTRQAGMGAETQLAARRTAADIFGADRSAQMGAIESDRAAQFAREQAQAGELGRTSALGLQGAQLGADTRLAARGLGADVQASDLARELQAMEGNRAAQMTRDEQRAAEQARYDDAMRATYGLESELGLAGTELAGSLYNQDRAANMEADMFNRTQRLAEESARADELFRADEATDRSRLAFGELGLGSAELRGRLGAQLADMGLSSREANMDRLGVLDQMGNARRTTEQARLDAAYQDFLTQQQYGQDQLAALSDIIRGNTRGSSATQMQFQQTNPYQQLLGAGITGLSLANQFGG